MIFYCSKRRCSVLQERWKDEASENVLDRANTRAKILEGKEAVLPWKRKVKKKSKDHLGFGLSKSYQHQSVKESYHQRIIYYVSVFSPNAGKCGPEKLRKRTLFSHWFCLSYLDLISQIFICIKLYNDYSQICQ